MTQVTWKGERWYVYTQGREYALVVKDPARPDGTGAVVRLQELEVRDGS